MSELTVEAPQIATKAKGKPIGEVPDLTPGLKAISLAAAASALAACGGGGGDATSTSATGGVTAGTTPAVGGQTITLPATGYAYPAPATDEQAARFLLQAQFSASDAEIASVRADGYAAWLERQVAQPYGPTGWDWLNGQGYGDVLNTANFYDNSYPADYMIWNQLMAAPDAMRKRMALALSEFFVVSLSGLEFHLAQPRHGALLGHAGRPCIWQLPQPAGSGDPECGDGLLPQHQGQQEGRWTRAASRTKTTPAR